MVQQKCKNCLKIFESSHKLRGHLAWCGVDITLIEKRLILQNRRIAKKQECVECKKEFYDSRNRKFCSLKCNASTNKNKRLNSILYGKTVRELEKYREFQKVCEICGRAETTKANRGNLAFDHDHQTGLFRGMLCFKCNTTFDYFEKYQPGFVQYSLKHSAR